MNIEAQKTLPPIAKVLGYGGLIPFVGLTVCILTGVDLSAFGFTDTHSNLLDYGAVIISFIGAVHWGVAMQSASKKQNAMLVYSVVPALVAWLWLFFSAQIALFGMSLALVAMLFIDKWLLKDVVPQAYLKMRMHLTVIVAVCLFLAAICV